MMWLLIETAGGIVNCIGIYSLLTFIQMQQNRLDDTSWCRWIMTWSILQKQPKSSSRQRNMKFFFSDQVSHSISTQQSRFSVVKYKTEGRKILKEEATEGGCWKALAEHFKGRNWISWSASVLSFDWSQDCRSRKQQQNLKRSQKTAKN